MSRTNFFAKGTLLIPSGSAADPNRRHLHVICTNPDPTGHQVLVSIATFWDGCDPTCIVLRHEHDWLWKEKSFVDYSYAHLRPHGLLVDGVERQVFESRQDMNGQVFLRICRGIQTSPFTPRPIKAHHRTVSAAVVQAKSGTSTGKANPAPGRLVDTSPPSS